MNPELRETPGRRVAARHPKLQNRRTINLQSRTLCRIPITHLTLIHADPDSSIQQAVGYQIVSKILRQHLVNFGSYSALHNLSTVTEIEFKF